MNCCAGYNSLSSIPVLEIILKQLIRVLKGNARQIAYVFIGFAYQCVNGYKKDLNIVKNACLIHILRWEKQPCKTVL